MYLNLDEQNAQINTQLTYVKAKHQQYVEKITKYYKEYVNKRDELALRKK